MVRFIQHYLLESNLSNSNFKKWFGNSVVVNNDGTPKVVYHGTKHKFNTFDISKQRSGDLGKGFYFTDNIDIAKALSQDGYVMPVYLSAQATTLDSIMAKYKGIILPKDINIQKYRNYKQYVVKDPNQIKSVDNNGQWSTTSNNIYE